MRDFDVELLAPAAPVIRPLLARDVTRGVAARVPTTRDAYEAVIAREIEQRDAHQERVRRYGEREHRELVDTTRALRRRVVLARSAGLRAPARVRVLRGRAPVGSYPAPCRNRPSRFAGRASSTDPPEPEPVAVRGRR